MIEYEESKKAAIDWLNSVEEVRELSEHEKAASSIPKFIDAWEIKTEIIGRNYEFLEISFYLFLEPDYPYSFPHFLLAPNSFDSLKYLPHVNISRTVCVFSNHAFPDPDSPLRVLKEAIRRAKRIIENGINGEGNELAFQEEFQAYWDDKYDKESEVIDSVVLLLENMPHENEVNVLQIHEPFNKVKYVVHRNEKSAIQFKSFLENYKLVYSEIKGFYLGELTNVLKEPPFSRSNRDIFTIVSSLGKEVQYAFKHFINKKSYPKLVLFSKTITNEMRYFGWFHIPVETNRNGFRPNTLSIYKTMSTFNGNTLVQRITPELMTRQRLVNRSTGKNLNNLIKVYSIVGLGSVGSHLVQFLNASKFDEFRLIDYEKLKIENLGRHFLGFRYVNRHKTKAMKDYLLQNSPTQSISTKEKSVVYLVDTEPNYLNDSDYIFVALGEANTEKWLANKMSSGLISRPIFFLWVEPHLLGGHCIYLNPNDNNYLDYFDKDFHFKYNVINKDEYLRQNPALSLKEAGCQSNYVPYSANNVMSFLGQLNSFITLIMNNNKARSKSFTWVGDKTLGATLKIDMSDYAQSKSSFTTIENPRP